MYKKDSKMIEYKSEDQCNALFCSKINSKSTGQRLQVLEIHFVMIKKKEAMEHMEQSRQKWLCC